MSGDNNFSNPLYRIAMEISRAGLDAADAGKLVRAALERKDGRLLVRSESFDLDSWDNVYLVSIGKAARPMAEGLLAVLGDRVAGGIITCPPSENPAPGKLLCVPSGHPLPDGESLRAADEALRLARKASRKDVIFFLVSGGGSAKFCLPAEGISLEEKRSVTDALLKSGADIHQINTVRKHISGIKGGRFAAAAFPATVLSLVVSDVIGNDLETIASGPAHWDPTTFAEARNILVDFGLWETAPPFVRGVLESGRAGEISETLKEGDPIFARVRTFIIGDNLSALDAARERAEKLGFKAEILTSSDRGEAAEAAKNYAEMLRSKGGSTEGRAVPRCFLAGGELTVTVRGKGRGGRNMEFVLASMIAMSGFPSNWLILSLGTDGRDGPTDAAGAWADPGLPRDAARLGLDPRMFLADNDSYTFFDRTGRLIRTRPTETNVMDLRIFLLDPRSGKE
ncbi:MAG: glycerate kinase type-2 family protein [Candidatus Aminicenantales bacterium]